MEKENVNIIIAVTAPASDTGKVKLLMVVPQEAFDTSLDRGFTAVFDLLEVGLPVELHFKAATTHEVASQYVQAQVKLAKEKQDAQDNS